MAEVKILGKTRIYPAGTQYLEIASDYQKEFEDDILLVRANGKLRELHKTLHGDCELSFLTARDPAGQKTYERSAVFLMLKAFYDVLPNEKIKKIQMDFALGNGIYGEFTGDAVLDDTLLSQVKERMKELCKARIPLM